MSLVGMTAPMRESILGPTQRGSLQSVAVSEGDLVKQGDLLFSLDDHVQQARTAIAKALSDSTLDIDRAKARWDQTQADYQRLQQLRGQDQTSSKEYNDSATRNEMARLDYEITKFEHEQAKLAYEREQAMAATYIVRAPYDGYIAQQLMDSGASLEENDEVLKLVQLNPLRVTLDCPLSIAKLVAAGDQTIITPSDAHWPSKVGVVNFVSRVVDAASQTIRVQIQVDNTEDAWPAGLKVAVTLKHTPQIVSQVTPR